jgi:hypothetical protein
MKYVKAILIWLLITPLAILNGALRDFVTEPLLGGIALPLSAVILSVMIFVMAYLLIPKIGKCTAIEYLLIGLAWFVLTNLFDLSMTIFLENGSMADFLAMYDITTGNLWCVVVLVCLISPILVAKIRKLIS